MPERLRLLDQRREDQEADQRDDAEDASVEDQDGKPPRKPLVPIGSTLLRSIIRTIGLKPMAKRPLT